MQYLPENQNQPPDTYIVSVMGTGTSLRFDPELDDLIEERTPAHVEVRPLYSRQPLLPEQIEGVIGGILERSGVELKVSEHFSGDLQFTPTAETSWQDLQQAGVTVADEILPEIGVATRRNGSISDQALAMQREAYKAYGRF